MIAKLTGVIDGTGTAHVIIDVNGVGYLVHASGRTLSRIGANKGAAVSLLIETIVREDQFTLYGFADAAEKEWFQILCTVQGVGAKAALAILSAVAPEQLPVVIAAGDKSALRRAEGVGEKLAVRIVTELKDKAGKIALGQTATQKGTQKKGTVTTAPAAGGIANDAVSALINLGYGRAEAFGVVSNIVGTKGDAVDLGELIRESLKELSA
ncbi:MAG: Holliday junction branch migration protein RuvA [Alphaproteobacteria bacterium]|nr:Holliday junction branch migration protein RuvA [Alphaproteobacteria bacterium]